MWEKIDVEFSTLLEEFELFLREQLPQKGGFLSEISRTVVESGGKRLRPAFVFLFYGLGPDGLSMLDGEKKERLFTVAAAVELLHTATLIHDDIVDRADSRRGAPTVSGKYGSDVAVYTGDYLLVQSLSLLARSSLDVGRLAEVARGLSAVCMGEVEQYLQRFQIASPVSYLKRIAKKTSALFSASAALGAHLAGLPERQLKNAARFGLYFGNAFQIRDDLLDILPGGSSAGKPVLKDLKEGIVTLPLIAAAKRNPSICAALERFFQTGEEPIADEIIRMAIVSGGVADSSSILERYLGKAKERLALLPETKSREVLSKLLDTMFISVG